jgi:hypothetical protein
MNTHMCENIDTDRVYTNMSVNKDMNIGHENGHGHLHTCSNALPIQRHCRFILRMLSWVSDCLLQGYDLKWAPTMLLMSKISDHSTMSDAQISWPEDRSVVIFAHHWLSRHIVSHRGLRMWRNHAEKGQTWLIQYTLRPSTRVDCVESVCEKRNKPAWS